MIWRVAAWCAVAALAVFNGATSPKTFVVFALQGIWYPSFLPAPLTLMLVLSGIIMALLHVLLTGIPVAVFERIWPGGKNSTASALLWLAVMLVPTAYTLWHLVVAG